MKKVKLPLLLTVICIFISTSTYSQDWIWSGFASGTSAFENVNGIANDDMGNVYVSGTFGADANLNGTALTTEGIEDIFIAKFTPAGALSWIRTGGSEGQDLARTIVVDDFNNVYVTGLFVKTAKFDSLALNDKGSRTLVSKDTKRDVFIAKYNSSGNMLWVKNVAWGPGNEVPEGMAIDNQNHIFLSGTFKDSIFFSSDTLEVQKSNLEGYIAHYDSDGNFQWVKQILQTSNGTKFLNISAAVNDQVYLAGILKDTMWIDGYEVYSRSLGWEDAIVMKMNEDGDVLWIRKGGSATADRANSVYADPFGSVFITGYFTGNANFDSTDLDTYDSHLLKSKGGYDMFVAKYSNNGNLRWIGTNGSKGDDIAYGLYSNEDIALVSGYLSDTIFFGKDTLVSTGGKETGFFVFDKAGAPIHGRTIEGDGDDAGGGLVFDENVTQTTIMGSFNSTNLAIPPLTSLTNADAGTSEGFIAAYDNPIAVSFTETTDPLLCAGDSSGYIKAKTFFGAGTITYSWEHDPLLTLDHADNLPAGTYKVVVEDETGSKDSISVTLSYPPAVVNTVEPSSNTELTCPEDIDGSIDITTTGGVSPYTYTWSGTGGGLCSSCEDQTGLGPGDYYVAAKDALGCITKDTITITRPDPFNFDGSYVDSIWINDPPPHDSGAVYLVVSGGTKPYSSFAWTGPESFTASTDTITGLIYAGNYIVTVTDYNSCIADTTFLVRSDTTFIAYIDSIRNVVCKGDNNGILEVEVDNGTAPFTYDWRNQFDVPAGNTKRVENLPPNTYTVTVTDDEGRKAQATHQIKQPTNSMTPLTSIKDPSCYGYVDGSIDLTVTGGWGDYTYWWTPGNETTEDLTDIGAGTYNCEITDKEGCKAFVINAELDNPLYFVFDNIEVTATVNCTGNQTAALEVHHSGGSPPFTYKWDDPNFQETKIALTLGARANPYKVVVTDDNECKVEGSKVLTEPTPVVVDSLTFTYPSVKGAGDATVTVHPSGGTPTYQYRRLSGDFQVSSTFTGLSAGTDTIVLVDNNGCESDIEIFTIPDPIEIDSIVTVDILCNGAADGNICVYASGGHGTLTYKWTGGPSSNCYSSLTAGSYVITISDSIKISIDSTITLVEPDIISYTAPVVTDNNCYNGADGSISISVAGGTGPYSYTIQPGGTMNSTGMFSGLNARKYVISIDDSENCGPKMTDSITVSEKSEISLSTAVVTDASCYNGSDGSIALTASGGTSPYSYTIKPGATTNATGTFTGLSAQKYVISVTDDESCGPKTSDSIAVAQPTMLIFDSILVASSHNSVTPTGKITIYASGGTPPYTYSSEGVDLASNIADNLYPGTYIIRVDDNQSCFVVNSSVVVGDSAVSIQDIAGFHNIILYPNPSTGKFTIEMENKSREDLMLEIVNITGQLVYKKQYEFNGNTRFIETIDLSRQAKGTYFMRVNGLPVKAKMMIE
ncbi:T9SS type A sorting domain-containing protein [Bacteroidota bacterium]